MIHSAAFYAGGAGNFAGLVSTVLFDIVVISRAGVASAYIDDLHFGVPAPSALAVFCLFSASAGGRRRNERRHNVEVDR